MFNALAIKIPMTFFREVEKVSLIFMGSTEDLNVKVIHSKKSNVGGIKIPDFKLYRKQHVAKVNGTEYKTQTQISYSHLIFVR
jgi:hypothetical protein